MAGRGMGAATKGGGCVESTGWVCSYTDLVCVNLFNSDSSNTLQCLVDFKEPNLPVWITIPSRTTLIIELRLNIPSVTKHPAIVPTFVISKVSRISADPTIFSSISGESIPSIAALISSIALYITE